MLRSGDPKSIVNPSRRIANSPHDRGRHDAKPNAKTLTGRALPNLESPCRKQAWVKRDPDIFLSPAGSDEMIGRLFVTHAYACDGSILQKAVQLFAGRLLPRIGMGYAHGVYVDTDTQFARKFSDSVETHGEVFSRRSN
ncbi:protein of unknown function [Hyphomicrobium sp. MC1]|nr:protein of unknown function [Hyphomicrobium sp. MC1]